MLRHFPLKNFYKINSIRFTNYCTKRAQPKLVQPEEKGQTTPKIDKQTIQHLERLSLVDFGDEKGIKIVEDAIKFADKLNELDTTGVEPLVTVLENESLYLREDVVKSDVSRSELLSHSKVVLEDYYVAPAGNIAFVPEEKEYHSQQKQEVELKEKSQQE